MRLPTTCACALLIASLTIAGCEHSATIPIDPETPWIQVTAGKQHACVLEESGDAYCWGDAELLGNGQSGFATLALEHVKAPAGVLFTNLSAGRAHTCALTRSATVYCWGSNNLGALGAGTGATGALPVPVSAPAGITFSAVTSGTDHSCALATTGPLYCWGQAPEGGGAVPTLVTLPSGVTFTSLTAGYRRTCGLTPAGAAYCWGENTYGAIGDSTTQDRTTPTLVHAPVGVSFVTITTGYEHTCALAASGVTYCWGHNEFGEVGDGSGSGQLTPVPVAPPPGVSFAAINAGGYHTCGITASGNVYCWGAESFGVTITGPKVPTSIDAAPGAHFASVDLGDGFTCGLTVDGYLRCWGGLVPVFPTGALQHLR